MLGAGGAVRGKIPTRFAFGLIILVSLAPRATTCTHAMVGKTLTVKLRFIARSTERVSALVTFRSIHASNGAAPVPGAFARSDPHRSPPAKDTHTHDTSDKVTVTRKLLYARALHFP